MNPAALELYLVTDPVLIGARPLAQVCEAALLAGVRILQLRDKQASARSLVEQARALRALTARHGGLLMINDRADVALAASADGVHLGQDDLAPEAARAILGPDKIIGVSVRSIDEARRAEAAGADYLAMNGVFATGTKIDLGEPLGLAGVRRLRDCTRLPLVAIGGIHAGNAGEVIAAGADAVAVVSAVMAAPDPGCACRRLLAVVAEARRVHVPGAG